MYSRTISPLAALQLLGITFFAIVARAESAVDADQVSTVLRQTAMPQMDNSRLGKVLNRYYTEGLGGVDIWEEFESLRVSGTLTLENGAFQLSAYQKKPHYIKMTVLGNQRDLVLGYDGKTAWRILSNSEEQAVPMEVQEARRFIHSARFGNYLLYPYALGKKIEYIDTVPVEGTICHQIRVILDTGFQVDYYIDIRTYLEMMVENTDLETGFVNSVIYDDYVREHGIPIAKHVENHEEGKWVSELILDEIKVNTGLMPWMFAMPEN